MNYFWSVLSSANWGHPTRPALLQMLWTCRAAITIWQVDRKVNPVCSRSSVRWLTLHSDPNLQTDSVMQRRKFICVCVMTDVCIQFCFDIHSFIKLFWFLQIKSFHNLKKVLTRLVVYRYIPLITHRSKQRANTHTLSLIGVTSTLLWFSGPSQPVSAYALGLDSPLSRYCILAPLAMSPCWRMDGDWQGRCNSQPETASEHRTGAGIMLRVHASVLLNSMDIQ